MDVKDMPVIATNSVHFPIMVLVYDVNDEYVIAKIGSAYIGWSDYVDNVTARRYKLYYAPRRDSYYFKYGRRRMYLDETLRTNIGG